MSVLHLQGLGLAYSHLPCFSNFNARLFAGQRVAIVGDNGSGKSSLLRLLSGALSPSEGRIEHAPGLRIGHLPQLLDEPAALSGGERVMHALTELLHEQPELLLLDEPSNHLDATRRRTLLRQLQAYPGCIVLVSHDVALMDRLCDTLWHIQPPELTQFQGRYSDYLQERTLQRQALEQQLGSLKRARQATHQALMQEQERASHARLRGAKSIEQRKWATVRSPTKLGRSNRTGVDHQAAIQAQQQSLAAAQMALAPAEVLRPRFQLPAAARSRACLLQISDGAAGHTAPLFQQLCLRLGGGERLALVGDNGSGKSTLARALCGDPRIQRSGNWELPPPAAVACLDQHYAHLPEALSVLETLQAAAPGWDQARLRHHLSDFLFRRNEAVQMPVRQLSGGERVRLALACIAARTPELLILDEPSNHLDQPTRQHLIEVLRAFPGAMLVISHDRGFLQEIGIEQSLSLRRGSVPVLGPL